MTQLPEIPQARLGFKLSSWFAARKRGLAVAGGCVFATLLFLSFVPLSDEGPPEAAEAKTGPASLLSAVPRWLGALMRRSDPEALLLGKLEPGDAAAPAGTGRVSTKGYDVLRRRRPGPSEGEQPTADAVPSADQLKPRGFGPSGSAAGGARAGAATSAAVPPAPGADEPAGPGLRAAAGGLKSGAPIGRGRGRQGRLVSGLGGGGAGAGGAGVSRSAVAAAEGQAGGASSGIAGSLMNPSVGRGASAQAPVPGPGRATTSERLGGAGGGPLTSGGGSGIAGHPCVKKHPRDMPGWNCRILRCLAPEVRDAFSPALVVSMVTHGARPQGAPAGPGGDLLGGIIGEGASSAAEYAKASDAIRADAAGVRFDCRDPRQCEDLMFCRNYVIDQLGRSADALRRSAALLTGAREGCRSLPFEADPTACFTKLRQAAGLDRSAAERAAAALKTALGEGERRCRSGEAEAQKLWEAFRNALAERLRPVLKIIEKPFCPDRLPCAPLGTQQLEESRGKAGKLSNALAGADQDIGLPAGPLAGLDSAKKDLDSAIALLRNPAGDRGLNFFAGLEAADRAASSLHGAAAGWDSAAAQCRSR